MAKKDDGKLWAVLSSVIPILFFIPIWIIKPKDAYAVYYGKQAFMLFLAAVVINVAGSIIPFIGWFIIWPIGSLAVFILWIFGIVHSASGEKKTFACDWQACY